MKKTLACVLTLAAVLVSTPASAMFDPDSDKNDAAIQASAGLSHRDMSTSDKDTLASNPATSDQAGGGSAEPQARDDERGYNHYQVQFLQELWTAAGGGD
jgi:hypothetical protein